MFYLSKKLLLLLEKGQVWLFCKSIDKSHSSHKGQNKSECRCFLCFVFFRAFWIPWPKPPDSAWISPWKHNNSIKCLGFDGIPSCFSGTKVILSEIKQWTLWPKIYWSRSKRPALGKTQFLMQSPYNWFANSCFVLWLAPCSLCPLSLLK